MNAYTSNMPTVPGPHYNDDTDEACNNRSKKACCIIGFVDTPFQPISGDGNGAIVQSYGRTDFQNRHQRQQHSQRLLNQQVQGRFAC